MLKSIEQLGSCFAGRLVESSKAADLQHSFRHFQDSSLRLFALGIGLLVYATELSSFTLSIDEEGHAYAIDLLLPWIGQGRWAMGLLSYVVPPLAAIPFVATAIFCTCLAVSALLLAGCFAPSRAEAFAFVGLFVSCPIWLHIGEFNTFSWGFGVGLCFASLAISLLHVGGFRAAIVASALTAFAMGFYQALLLTVVCGGLLGASFELRGMSRSQLSSRRLVLLGGTIVASSGLAALLHYGVSAFALFATGQKLTYVDHYLRIGELLNADSSGHTILRAMARAGRFLLGSDPTFLGWGAASLLLTWAGVSVALARLAKSDGVARSAKLLSLLFVLGSVVVALLPILASAGLIPTRALTALPLLYATAGAYMMRVEWSGQRAHWFAFCAALLINSWIAATLFNADAIARDRDRLIATILAERIANVPGVKPDQPFVVVGQWSHEVAGPAARVEVFGASFFEQDGGDTYRIHRYLELQGVRGLRPEPITLARDHLAEIEDLPSWPAPGSVALVADHLVIKFGPLSNQQKLALAAAGQN